MVGEVTYLLLGMAYAIDLSNLSFDELYVLAGRVECRIKTLSASTDEHAATTAPADPWAASEEVGPEPFRPGMASGVQSESRAKLSEKVQDLINTNDPWEGSGVGPTRWSLPFYGGHIVRTHGSAACLHRAQYGPALLPVFGGPPCSDISGQASKISPTQVQPTAASAQRFQPETCLQLCAICYSPCCLGGTTHGLHACERDRRG